MINIYRDFDHEITSKSFWRNTIFNWKQFITSQLRSQCFESNRIKLFGSIPWHFSNQVIWFGSDTEPNQTEPWRSVNSIDKSSRRSNYKNDVNFDLKKLLSILQNKLRLIDFLKIFNAFKMRKFCVTITQRYDHAINIENKILKLKNDIFRSILSHKINDDCTSNVFRHLIIVLIVKKIHTKITMLLC